MSLNRVKGLLLIFGLIMILAACNATTTDSTSPAPPVENIQEQVEVDTDTTASEPEDEQEGFAEAIEAQDEAPSIGEDNLLAGAEPVEIERDPDVPHLPFADNPDPALCGIPQPWNSDAPAYLSGIYEDELIQPIVFLYDSHLRRKVVTKAPHGAEIKILLSQSNPELDYFLVKIIGGEQPNEGWIPAPFVSFEPPPQL